MNGLAEDGIEFDFFAEPETVEMVEQQRRRPQPLQSLRGQRGGNGRGRPPPPGLVGIGRLAGLVTVVIVAVVALVSGLGACQGAGEDYAGYLRGVGVLAQSSSGVGAELASDLRTADLTSSDLARRLQNLAAQEQQTYDRATQIRPPGPLRQVHGELLAALELRASGLAGLGQALAQVRPGRNAVASAADALAAQARLLTASDVVWNELYLMPVAQELRARRIIGLVVPQSRFVSKPDLVGAAAFTRLLQRLHRTTNRATNASPAPLLKPGTSGRAVAAWQNQLNRWLRTQPGQPLLPADGVFGTLTGAATKALQQTAGITADGIVGPATRRALAGQLARIK